MNPTWRGINLICSMDGDQGSVMVKQQPVPAIRHDLMELFDRAELAKYLTEPELAGLDQPSVTPEQGTQA